MDELQKLFTQARTGTLPPDFDRWEISDAHGWTVAHVAAFRGHLPPNFDRWDISDAAGSTVAHVAAYQGHLPPEFDRWELVGGCP